METQRPRRRVRIGTLMLLVLEQTKRLVAEQRAAAEQLRADAEARRAADCAASVAKSIMVAEEAQAAAAQVEARLREELEEAEGSGSKME